MSQYVLLVGRGIDVTNELEKADLVINDEEHLVQCVSIGTRNVELEIELLYNTYRVVLVNSLP